MRTDIACQISSHGVPVDAVHLVEVDVVGAQPAERLIGGAPDAEGGELAAVGRLGHGAEGLRRRDRSLGGAPPLANHSPMISLVQPGRTPLFPSLAEQGTASAVPVGRIEEVDTQFMGPIQMAAISALARGPKFMVPTQRRLTESPVRPRRVYRTPTVWQLAGSERFQTIRPTLTVSLQVRCPVRWDVPDLARDLAQVTCQDVDRCFDSVARAATPADYVAVS